MACMSKYKKDGPASVMSLFSLQVDKNIIICNKKCSSTLKMEFFR